MFDNIPKKEKGKMSYFDEIKNKLFDTIGDKEGGHAGLIESIMGMVTNKESGGLAGLLNNFKENGLGDIISSWISTGENQPISADQIQAGVGKEKIQQLADKMGMSPDAAKSKLAELLPDIVDKLTAEGKIPEGGLFEKTLGFFKSSSEKGGKAA